MNLKWLRPLDFRPRDPALLPYAPGLRFAFFNSLTWQIAIGTPLILLTESLGGTSAQTGLAYSFIFLLTPIQLLATVLLPKYGYRRLTLAGWSGRSALMLVPLGISIAVPWTGVQGWMIQALIVSVFFFCLLRSMGMAASVPWFMAMIPADKRGQYFGSEHFVSGLASILTLFSSVAAFALLPVFPALAVQFCIAIVGSMMSVAALAQLPDVEAPRSMTLGEVVRGLARLAFGGRAFGTYFWVSVGCYAATTPLTPLLAYHLRADRGLEPGWIMVLELLRYTGSAVAAVLLRKRVDVLGARPFLLFSLAAYIGLSVWWWAGLRLGVGGLSALALCYLLIGAASTSWMVGNLGFLPKLLNTEERMLGVTLQSAGAAMAGGVATVAWGWILKSQTGGVGLHPGLFPWLFIAASVIALVSLLALVRIREPDTSERSEFGFSAILLRPHRALATLIQCPPAQKP